MKGIATKKKKQEASEAKFRQSRHDPSTLPLVPRSTSRADTFRDLDTGGVLGRAACAVQVAPAGRATDHRDGCLEGATWLDALRLQPALAVALGDTGGATTFVGAVAILREAAVPV